MKKIKFVSLFVLALTLFACGGDAAKSDEAKTEVVEETPVVDYNGMEMIDLNPFNIPASLYIADGTKGKQDIRSTPQESVVVKVGSKFGIEIIPFGLTISEKKEELAGGLVYKIEYLEETTNKLVYKQSIPGTEMDPEFHFFYDVEINGDIYSIKSLNKEYTEKDIAKMVISAESFTEKNPA